MCISHKENSQQTVKLFYFQYSKQMCTTLLNVQSIQNKLQPNRIGVDMESIKNIGNNGIQLYRFVLRSHLCEVKFNKRKVCMSENILYYMR